MKFATGHNFAAAAICVVFASALILLLAACTPKPTPPQPPPPPKMDDLHFPVMVMFPTAATILYKDAAGLGSMYMNLVMMPDPPPVLVDSNFDVYTLEHLHSTHGGLWLMTHPSGTTEVEFTLTRAPRSGLEAAREAARTHLGIQTWRHDVEKKRAKLATQTTLKGLLDIVRTNDSEE